MNEQRMDLNRDLMLDGNSVAGLLHEIFATEMTITPAECVHCGTVSEIGATLAFTQAPGIVLRCPGCENIMLRIVETEDSYYLDTRGATYLRINKRADESTGS